MLSIWTSSVSIILLFNNQPYLVFFLFSVFIYEQETNNSTLDNSHTNISKNRPNYVNVR